VPGVNPLLRLLPGSGRLPDQIRAENRLKSLTVQARVYREGAQGVRDVDRERVERTDASEGIKQSFPEASLPNSNSHGGGLVPAHQLFGSRTYYSQPPKLRKFAKRVNELAPAEGSKTEL